MGMHSGHGGLITSFADKVSLKRLERFQRLANVLHYFGGYSPFPMALIIELTTSCNLRCEMCFSRRDPSKMKLVEVKGIIDDLKRTFFIRPMIHLCGGEPLLHREFLDAVSYVKSTGFRCSITTNGVLLGNYAKDLVSLGLDRLHVSIDGPAHVHDEIRGVPGSFERAMTGLYLIRDIKRAKGVTAPTVTINCVMSAANYHCLADMIEIATGAGADFLSYQHLVFSEEVDHGMDLEHLSTEICKIRRLNAPRGLSVVFYPHLEDWQIREYYGRSLANLGSKCVFPWLVTRVRANGDISPCHAIMGNIRTDTLSEVWNGTKFRSFRRKLARHGIFSDCGRCCHRQY